MNQNVDRADIERRMKQIAWPLPAETLRSRVLSAARATHQPATWSDRVWFSRGWRLAAAAVVVCAIGVEALPAPAMESDGQFSEAEARAIADITREAGIPADVAETLASRALAVTRFSAADPNARAALMPYDTEGDRR
jgi:hypothetical protein